MYWTKKHSKNAVAAKERLRQQRNDSIPDWKHSKLPNLRRPAPDFTINIRTRSGERVQITAVRYGKQFITADGVKSARSIARGIELILRHFHAHHPS